MSKTKSPKNNYAIPGKPLGEQEFGQMIQQAENGNFHTIEAVKTELEKWKTKYSK